MKAKKIYWVIGKDRRTSAHERKIKALRTQQIVPTIISDFEELFDAYNHHRTSVVIIGDEFDENDLFQGFQEISHHPELAGTRFILSLSKSDDALVRKAVQQGFRDIIPIDMVEDLWIQRYKFATSGTNLSYPQPVPQMTLRNISAIRVPARIVWINENQLRIETRVKLDPGSKLKLMGGLADYLGVKWVTVSVEEHQKTNLRYRFSDGYICNWRLPESLYHKKQGLLDNLMDHRVKAPHKAYVAISSYEIRQALIRRLNSPLININVALHKKSMAEEPRFLNPDIVFIEEKLTKGANRSLFVQMLKSIRKDAPIYIVGRDINEEYYQLWEEDRGQEFIYLRKLTQNFSDIVLRKLERINPLRDVGPAFYIRKDHPLSFADVNLSARLLKIHPEAVEIAVPYQVSNYGIIGLESPITKNVLDRNVYAKVTTSYHHDNPDVGNFPYLLTCYLSDLMNRERILLGDHIVRVFTDKMQKELEILRDLRPAVSEEEEEDDIVITPGGGEPEERSLDEEDIPILYRPPPKDTRSFSERFFDSFVKHRRELGILAVAMFFFSIFFVLLYFVRPPESEQGKVYSDQLLKFQQRFQRDK